MNTNPASYKTLVSVVLRLLNIVNWLKDGPKNSCYNEHYCVIFLKQLKELSGDQQKPDTTSGLANNASTSFSTGHSYEGKF